MAAPKGKKKLTPKQQRFVQEYLIDLNATQAAIRAGYSERTAKQVGSENLTKPYIVAILQHHQKRLQNKLEITQERVLEEYAKLAFLDPRKFFDDDGNLIPVQDLPEEAAAALTGMDIKEIYETEDDKKVNVGRILKIKYADKKGALDSLAKHLGLLKDHVQHDHDMVLRWGTPEDSQKKLDDPTVIDAEVVNEPE